MWCCGMSSAGGCPGASLAAASKAEPAKALSIFDYFFGGENAKLFPQPPFHCLFSPLKYY